VYEPETSTALGFGFRCGFLGLLHMEIVRERLEREFGLELISTAPNVVYRVVMESGAELMVTNPSDFPAGGAGTPAPGGAGGKAPAGKIAKVYEPVVRATIISPSEYIGTIMDLCQGRRGVLGGMEYLSSDRVEIRYTMPLAEIIFDFFDQLKSRTRGFASLDYEPDGEQEADLVKVDILLQGQPVDAFSQIVHADNAREYGLAMTARLKELIPRQQFEVPIQAAVGARIIARENIRALRKDVLAKCYGGDITRKRKLLERQKEGKRRMKTIGRVDVPQEAFVAALSTQQGQQGAEKKAR
jgi:GTP-binding protein LepA